MGCEQGCARRLARGRHCARGARGTSEGGGAEGDLGARERGGWAVRGRPLMGRFPAVRAEGRRGSRRGGDSSDAELLLLMPFDVWLSCCQKQFNNLRRVTHYVGGVFFECLPWGRGL